MLKSLIYKNANSFVSNTLGSDFLIGIALELKCILCFAMKSEEMRKCESKIKIMA
jgi:hypothetical protein